MRDELIDITRMLMKLPPAVRGDLPAPTEGGDLSHALTPAPEADSTAVAATPKSTALDAKAK